MELIPRWRNNI